MYSIISPLLDLFTKVGSLFVEKEKTKQFTAAWGFYFVIFVISVCFRSTGNVPEAIECVKMLCSTEAIENYTGVA